MEIKISGKIRISQTVELGRSKQSSNSDFSIPFMKGIEISDRLANELMLVLQSDVLPESNQVSEQIETSEVESIPVVDEELIPEELIRLPEPCMV